MGTPFDALIAANPTAGVLHLPAAAAAYNPSQTYATPVAAASDPAVVGLFTRELAAGLAVVFDAQFTIPYAALTPDQAQPELLKATVDGTAFNVAKVRKRYWKGVQVAWTLMLTS